jgi:hypothetical protein
VPITRFANKVISFLWLDQRHFFFLNSQIDLHFENSAARPPSEKHSISHSVARRNFRGQNEKSQLAHKIYCWQPATHLTEKQKNNTALEGVFTVIFTGNARNATT